MTSDAIDHVPDPATLFRLDGAVAVVTGAGSGIGRLAARVLARAGAKVVATDADAGAADATAKAIAADGHAGAGLGLDVTDETAVAAAFAAIERDHGPVGVLVNSAGISRRLPTEDLDLATWQSVLDVNLTGTFLCAREAGRQMLKAGGGSIINISSMYGHVGNASAGNLSYHASKGAVVTLTKGLAVEWGPRGVRVNDIAPTFIETGMTGHLFADPAMVETMKSLTPLAKTGVPGDLAGAVLFLASPASSLVTGHSLLVDAGWTAR